MWPSRSAGVSPSRDRCDWETSVAVVTSVVDFYEVPRDQIRELHCAASGSGARIGHNQEQWKATLAGLRRPVPRYESHHYYFAAVLGVVGGTPLPGGEEMLSDGLPAFADLLMELVERRGGAGRSSNSHPTGSPRLTPPASTRLAFERITQARSTTTRTRKSTRTTSPACLARYWTACSRTDPRPFRPTPATRCCATLHSYIRRSPRPVRTASCSYACCKRACFARQGGLSPREEGRPRMCLEAQAGTPCSGVSRSVPDPPQRVARQSRFRAPPMPPQVLNVPLIFQVVDSCS